MHSFLLRTERRGRLLLAAAVVGAAGMTAAWQLPFLPPETPAPLTAAWSDPAASLPLRVSFLHPAEPARLLIPCLGVDAAVEHVGMTPERDMDVPADDGNVGWYRLGPRPGERGNAVLAGHLDSQTGPAVFWELADLHEGDRVLVVDAEGREWPFTVRESVRYRDDDPPLQRIFGWSGVPRLNLITCGGAWDTGIGSYEERLVVFTEPAW